MFTEAKSDCPDVSSNLTTENILKLYEVYRGYIQHEDSLINYRTTWFITIQSFIIASFALSYQKKFEVCRTVHCVAADRLTAYNGLLLALTAIGLATAIVAYISIKAAVDSIKELKACWKTVIDGKDPHRYLPKLTGGGAKNAHRYGLRMPMWVPGCFVLFWALAFIAVTMFDILPLYYASNFCLTCELVTKAVR